MHWEKFLWKDISPETCPQDKLKPFDSFKKKQKSRWSHTFWNIKVYIFWMIIQYSIYWVEKQTLEAFS